MTIRLKGTFHMRLRIRFDCMSQLRWYVDVSYCAHMDVKGHTSMMMTLGRGSPMSFARGQNINVRSSTKEELVGVDDAITSIMLGKHFIEAQAYDVTHNILYQYHKSTILLATNGRASSLRNTKHIHS